MRHFMADPDNQERLLKVPPHVVAWIKAEAFMESARTVEQYAEERLNITRHPNMSEDIYAALLVAANRVREQAAMLDMGRRIDQFRRQPSLSDDASQGYDGQWHRDLYGGDDAA